MIDEILQSSADAQILSGADGRIRVANSQAERLFGYDPGELDGKPIEILIPGDFRERHRALRERYIEAPRARPMVSGLDLYGCRKDGSTFRAEIALNPIMTDDGILVTSTIRSIDSADDSEAYFRHLLESAPDAMITIDDQGKIAIVNGQAVDMFGYDREAMLGQPIELLLPDRLTIAHHDATDCTCR